MSTPRLYTIFEYLATLIVERGPDEPFMLSQLQPAIQYKFPDFSFATYELSGLRDLILSGEKAGYFKLVNTGNMQTAYLVSGTKAISSNTPTASGTGDLGSNDPRRTRWMTLALENMLAAERGDQVLDAIRGLDALSPEFDAFLVAQMKGTLQYSIRGKLKRLRDFLTTIRAKGEAQAAAQWQTSRAILKMPSPPPIEGTGQIQPLLWALLQGNKRIEDIPVEQINEPFIAMVNFNRDFMISNKAWDWVEAFNMLEAEARAVPRPIPSAPKKAGLFGTGKPLPPPPPMELNEAQIKMLTEQYLQASGAAKNQVDTAYTGYAATPNLDTSFRFLSERPKLVEDDKLISWLDDQISENIASGNIEAVRNYANKAAIVLGIRQLGFDGLRQNVSELKAIYDSVMDGAKQLNTLFTFINAPDIPQAVKIFQEQPALIAEEMAALFEDQLIRAAHRDDISRYQQVNERLDLWRNLVDFGAEEGVHQHERYLSGSQDERDTHAAMGILLLGEATNADERQEIIGRYPAVASKTGLNMITQILETLSFQNADPDVYNHHFEIKRLIERCLELGINRALAELK